MFWVAISEYDGGSPAPAIQLKLYKWATFLVGFGPCSIGLVSCSNLSPLFEKYIPLRA